MIVLPCAEPAREALGRYIKHRRLAERGAVMEAAISGAIAGQLADEHGFVEGRLRAYVPRVDEAAVAEDGLSLLVRGDPWWRAMLAVTAVDRIGGWHDPEFGISNLDTAWTFDPELDDFVIELVGVRRVVELVELVHAAASAHLATSYVRHAAASARAWVADVLARPFAELAFASAYGGRRREVSPRDARQAFLLGGVAAVVDSLGKLGDERRAIADRVLARTARFALVRWTPSHEELAELAPVDEGMIDMHNPSAHIVDAVPPKPAVMAVETLRMRDTATDVFVAGFRHGAEAVRRLMYPPPGSDRVPLHLADLADLALPRNPRTP